MLELPRFRLAASFLSYTRCAEDAPGLLSGSGCFLRLYCSVRVRWLLLGSSLNSRHTRSNLREQLVDERL
jgi:hypothetical protein